MWHVGSVHARERGLVACSVQCWLDEPASPLATRAHGRVQCWLDEPASPLATRAQGHRPPVVLDVRYLAPRPTAGCRVALFLSLCCLRPGQVPLSHAICRVVALADWLRRLATCRTGQAACLFVRRAWAHICMATEYWPKFFCQSMASSSVCSCIFKCMFHLDVACVSSEYYIYVAMAIHCKYMFQIFRLFQTYVVSVLSICCVCCKDYTHMLQVYVSNVSAVSNVCCKYFI
jgi:hypothetical protein